MHKRIKKGIACILIVFIPAFSTAQIFTDTIFYNAGWQICEQPVAVYYRIGTLVIDSFWYYKGPFKDYAIDGTVLHEGNYSDEGFKDGTFSLYDTSGSLIAQGNYTKNKPIGDWEFRYPSGDTRAIINFPEAGGDYVFKYYRDSSGQVLLNNGNGTFEWNSCVFEDRNIYYKFKGTYKDGKRSETWKYYESRDQYMKSIICQENYTDDGSLKKARSFGYYNETFHHHCIELDMVPASLKRMELMSYDNFFRRGPDSNAVVNLWNYLKSRKAVDIVIKNKKFEDAIVYVLVNLESYRSRLDYEAKDIDGKIEFKLGDNSTPENITVKGNITDKEKDFLLYLMSKFKNFEMPMTESIGYEQYHTIYFYSIDMKPYVPAAIKNYVGRELFFTMLPKDKYLVFLEANKKKIKRAIRSEYMRYW